MGFAAWHAAWRTCACVSSMVSMVMVKIECERDESWFISVAPTERFFLPT